MFAMHSQIQTNPEKNKPSVFRIIVIGSCAAMAEVAIDQPLVYFKNSIQQGKSISWSPKYGIAVVCQSFWLGTSNRCTSNHKPYAIGIP